MDVKGRILFIFGLIGTACFYWKSGKQFNITSVGIVGVQEEKPDPGVIENPFNVKQSMLERRVDTDVRWKKMEGNMSDFTLNVNFNLLLSTDKKSQNILQKQREILLCSDKLQKRLYLSDSLNPAAVFCISTTSAAEFADTPVNTRVVKTFNLEKARNYDKL